MKTIKTRIKSIDSTMQITKAMELVASSKLRHAKQQEEAVKPFYHILCEAITDIIRQTGEKNQYIRPSNAEAPTCFIVIAGDRGLAGGYNNNLFKLVAKELKEGDCIIPVGRKSADHYGKLSYPILTTEFLVAEETGIPESHEIGHLICDGFAEGRFGRVALAYTEFINMLTQEPRLAWILPLDRDALRAEAEEGGRPRPTLETIYEPSPEAVLRTIIPQYVSGMVYGAVCEAEASELAARRTAMSAANKNAGEMISTLTLKYNRARQAMITQEITEIIAGSETL